MCHKACRLDAIYKRKVCVYANSISVDRKKHFYEIFHSNTKQGDILQSSGEIGNSYRNVCYGWRERILERRKLRHFWIVSYLIFMYAAKERIEEMISKWRGWWAKDIVACWHTLVVEYFYHATRCLKISLIVCERNLVSKKFWHHGELIFEWKNCENRRNFKLTWHCGNKIWVKMESKSNSFGETKSRLNNIRSYSSK